MSQAIAVDTRVLTPPTQAPITINALNELIEYRGRIVELESYDGKSFIPVRLSKEIGEDGFGSATSIGYLHQNGTEGGMIFAPWFESRKVVVPPEGAYREEDFRLPDRLGLALPQKK